MSVFSQLAIKRGLIKAKMPKPLPHIAVCSMIILDRLVQKVSSLEGIVEAIDEYPEDTHREGFVCENMMGFVAEFSIFEKLKQGVEQQIDNNGGRSSTKSHYDSMERLESWYDK